MTLARFLKSFDEAVCGQYALLPPPLLRRNPADLPPPDHHNHPTSGALAFTRVTWAPAPTLRPSSASALPILSPSPRLLRAVATADLHVLFRACVICVSSTLFAIHSSSCCYLRRCGALPRPGPAAVNAARGINPANASGTSTLGAGLLQDTPYRARSRCRPIAYNLSIA